MAERVQLQVKREGTGILLDDLKKMQAVTPNTIFDQAVLTLYELLLYRQTDQMSSADGAAVEAAALRHRVAEPAQPSHIDLAALAAQVADLQAAQVDLAAQVADLQAALAHLRVEIYYTRQMTAVWQYSNTAGSPPGSGQMRTNTAQTEMYLHSIDDGGYNRTATLESITAFTGINPKACRFRVRGATGAVFELQSNGKATKTGLWYTIPITVISGAAVDKGFRVELTVLSEIWAEDPPPLPTTLPV